MLDTDTDRRIDTANDIPTGKMPEVKEPQVWTVLERQIVTVDKQIDRLVYDLYGLSEEDVRVVSNEVL